MEKKVILVTQKSNNLCDLWILLRSIFGHIFNILVCYGLLKASLALLLFSLRTYILPSLKVQTLKYIKTLTQ